MQLRDAELPLVVFDDVKQRGRVPSQRHPDARILRQRP
jgi:hypothetical protein